MAFRNPVERMRGSLDRLRRLESMSHREVLYRLQEAVRRETDRVRTRLRASDDPLARFRQERVARRVDGVAGAPPALRYLEESACGRFYPPGDGAARDELIWVVEERFPEWLDRAVQEGRHLAVGRVPLLGLGRVDVGTAIDWHRDPVTDGRWERRFWADFDLVGGDNPGDPKVIHELNRHQHLPRLAKAWYLTGEESFAEAALTQIDSWIDQNPPGVGINWASSLEIALRALSWMWTIFLVRGAPGLDEARAQRILGSLFAQLDHVERYPSIHSSPNTHLIGEAAALFVAGVTFDGLPSASSWKETGRRILVQEIERQTVGGGVHAELSSYYHCYSLDFFLQAMILARQNEVDLPSRAWRRLGDQLDFVLHLTRPDGTLPLLGDDDGGRALALSARDYRCFADGLCTGAVLFERGDWKWVAGGFREETLWLLGPAAWRRHRALPARPPARLRSDHAEAGYFVQRTGWGEEHSHLVFDCGGLGRLGGGHGHADALSLVLADARGEILADPGTYLYNGDPVWRDHFRSTGAHNTVVVDGRSQSRPGGTFGWRSRARARVTGSLSRPGIEFVEGEHDGYRALSEPAVHRRRVLQVQGDYWLIFDDVRGRGDHEIELGWQLGPRRWPLRVEEIDGGMMVEVTEEVTEEGAETSFRLCTCATSPVDLDVARGREDPPAGWVSRGYGHREPAPALRLRMRSALPAGYLTLLSCRTGEAPEPASLRTLRPGPRGDLVLTLRRGNTTDRVLMGLSGSPVQLGRLQARAEVVWMRTRDGRLERAFARNVRYLAWGDLVLAHSPTPYLCWPGPSTPARAPKTPASADAPA